MEYSLTLHWVPDTNAGTDMFLKAQLCCVNVAHQNARHVDLCWQAARLMKRPLRGWASKTI
jgi:hypothetical protein